VSFVVVPAPLKKMLNVGWAHRKFHDSSEKVKLELLRGKGMSLMAESRGAPILQSMASMLLRMTDGHHFRIDDSWTRMKIKGASFDVLPVSERVRDVMEEAHGYSWNEQLELESYFDSINSIQMLSHPILTSHASLDQLHYAVHYVKLFEGDRPTFELPSCKN